MDQNTGNNVSKGIIISFTILGALVILLGAIYLSVYLNALILGSVFGIASDSNESIAVTATTFTVYNQTNSSLGHTQIISDTLAVYNASNGYEWGIDNFSIDYPLGLISINDALVLNQTAAAANYSYVKTTGSNVPVTETTKTFLGTSESSFFTANNSVLNGLTFATSLIPIAIILLVLGGVIVGGYYGYKYLKKKGKGDMGY